MRSLLPYTVMEVHSVNDTLVCTDDDGGSWRPPERNDSWRFERVARAASEAGQSIPEYVRDHFEPSDEPDPSLGELETPVAAGEVWAAGVTYQISEEAREGESTLPEVYRNVYSAERPELFFKATPRRTVAPGEAVGIRGDSNWDVPEPELGIVLFEEEIVGFTVGNDVSSRELEGENPLYLPQAKVYDRCCALGPGIVTADAIADPHDLTMEMTIERDGETCFEGSTSTAEMVRTCEELVSFLTRHNSLPPVTVLLTGTSLVPEDGFTLEAGDEIAITIEGLGTLENPVQVV
jgi:2-dehydro-3-deoxy-D-arabinonate dehydratase